MTRPKHGGKRPGAGRKPGTQNALPKGFVVALKAMKHRLPEDASEEVKAVAARAFERLVDVMEERVPVMAAGHVLKAATLLREEVCGRVAQPLEHSGPAGGQLVIEVHKYSGETE